VIANVESDVCSNVIPNQRPNSYYTQISLPRTSGNAIECTLFSIIRRSIRTVKERQRLY